MFDREFYVEKIASNMEEFTDFDETIKRVDRDWAGLAPHKIVKAYCDEGIQ